jgi:XTP/dITP diphosphohydrolase
VKLLLATRNAGKLRELGALLGSDWTVETLVDHPEIPDVAEEGETFEENARLKAMSCAKASGLATLADDSGLCVDALGGQPGVRSARYALGPDAARIAKLLDEMKGVAENRGAAFRCALCLASPDGTTVVESGECRGQIAREPRGRNGFGYDPVFFIPELGRTMAELSPEEKALISHRGRALARMAPHLERLRRAKR